MDLSVIIVNWNTKELTSECLASVFKFTKEIKFEVVLVDNGSTDGSVVSIKKKFPQIKIIENKKNLGFTKANNQGIKLAKGNYVLMLNSDTYLVENSFKKLIEKASNIPNFGVISPLLLNENKSIQQSTGFFPHLPQIFWWITFIDDLPGGAILNPYHIDHDNFYKKEREVGWVSGAALLTSQKVTSMVGYLDEKIFMYGEDVDFCFRVKKLGLRVLFSPETKIIHVGGGSHNKVRTPAFIGEYNGLKYLYKKYKSNFSLQILVLLLKIGALLRIVAFTFVGRAKLARAYVEVFKVA